MPNVRIELAEVHLSWNASDIKAIFYVNDTLTPRRAPLPDALADARVGEEAARYRARGVHADLMDRALKAAQAAYGNALLAQKMMLNRTGDILLPVVQMKLTTECFDGRPLAQRLRAAQQAGDGRVDLPRVFDAPLSDGYAGMATPLDAQHEHNHVRKKQKSQHASARTETEAERRERESWGL